jgi:hypothetical protein
MRIRLKLFEIKTQSDFRPLLTVTLLNLLAIGPNGEAPNSADPHFAVRNNRFGLIVISGFSPVHDSLGSHRHKDQTVRRPTAVAAIWHDGQANRRWLLAPE